MFKKTNKNILQFKRSFHKTSSLYMLSLARKSLRNNQTINNLESNLSFENTTTFSNLNNRLDDLSLQINKFHNLHYEKLQFLNDLSSFDDNLQSVNKDLTNKIQFLDSSIDSRFSSLEKKISNSTSNSI